MSTVVSDSWPQLKITWSNVVGRNYGTVTTSYNVWWHPLVGRVIITVRILSWWRKWRKAANYQGKYDTWCYCIQLGIIELWYVLNLAASQVAILEVSKLPQGSTFQFMSIFANCYLYIARSLLNVIFRILGQAPIYIILFFSCKWPLTAAFK